MSKFESSYSLFDDSASSNVRKFFLYYENVLMKNKTNEEKAGELFSHLDCAAFAFFLRDVRRRGKFETGSRRSSFG